MLTAGQCRRRQKCHGRLDLPHAVQHHHGCPAGGAGASQAAPRRPVDHDGPDRLASDDQARLDAIRGRSPALDKLVGHVRGFADMMCNLRGDQLPQWMEGAAADNPPGPQSFVDRIKRDLAAVTAGLTLPWSSDAVEGQVNRIKMIKRALFS